MNDQLAGFARGELPEHVERLAKSPAEVEAFRGALRAIKNSGLSQVQSCEDARAFVRLKNASLGQSEQKTREAVPPPEERPSSVPVTRLPSGAPEGRVDKILFGQLWFNKSTVRSRLFVSSGTSNCTGVVIGRDTLLTSAHCLPGGGGWRRLAIDYGESPKFGCLTSTCDDTGNATAWAWIHPAWFGAGDYSHDIAMIWNPTPWPSPADTTEAWHPIINSDITGGTYWSLGYGHGSETGTPLDKQRLTSNQLTVDYAPLPQWFWRDSVDAGQSRVCKGDSGGPAVNTDADVNLLIGLPSFQWGEFYEDADGEATCAKPGATTFFTALVNKTSWINCTGTGCPGPCTQHFSSTGPGGTGAHYIKCWN